MSLECRNNAREEKNEARLCEEGTEDEDHAAEGDHVGGSSAGGLDGKAGRCAAGLHDGAGRAGDGVVNAGDDGRAHGWLGSNRRGGRSLDLAVADLRDGVDGGSRCAGLGRWWCGGRSLDLTVADLGDGVDGCDSGWGGLGRRVSRRWCSRRSLNLAVADLGDGLNGCWCRNNRRSLDLTVADLRDGVDLGDGDGGGHKGGDGEGVTHVDGGW